MQEAAAASHRPRNSRRRVKRLWRQNGERERVKRDPRRESLSEGKHKAGYSEDILTLCWGYFPSYI